MNPDDFEFKKLREQYGMDKPEPIGPPPYRRYLPILLNIIVIVVVAVSVFWPRVKHVRKAMHTPTPAQTAPTPENIPMVPASPQPTPPPNLPSCPRDSFVLAVLMDADGIVVAGRGAPIATIPTINGMYNYMALKEQLKEIKARHKDLTCIRMVWGYPPDGTEEQKTLQHIIKMSVPKIGVVPKEEFLRILSVPMS